MLFRAETEEELAEIESLEVPVMKQAINAYHSITTSNEFREKERLWSKARHDEATALNHARLEGRQEGRQEGKVEGIQLIARNALQMNIPVDDIAKMTGLTHDEINDLGNSN